MAKKQGATFGVAKPAMKKTMKTFNKNYKTVVAKQQDPREQYSNSLMTRKPKKQTMNTIPNQPSMYVEGAVRQLRTMRNA